MKESSREETRIVVEGIHQLSDDLSLSFTATVNPEADTLTFIRSV